MLQKYTAGRIHCRLNFHFKNGGLHAGFVPSRVISNFSFLELLLEEYHKIVLKHTLTFFNIAKWIRLILGSENICFTIVYVSLLSKKEISFFFKFKELVFSVQN